MKYSWKFLMPWYCTCLGRVVTKWMVGLSGNGGLILGIGERIIFSLWLQNCLFDPPSSCLVSLFPSSQCHLHLVLGLNKHGIRLIYFHVLVLSEALGLSLHYNTLLVSTSNCNVQGCLEPHQLCTWSSV